MSKDADILRAAEALQAIKALVEANQSATEGGDDGVLTLDSVVWRSPRETVEEDSAPEEVPASRDEGVGPSLSAADTQQEQDDYTAQLGDVSVTAQPVSAPLTDADHAGSVAVQPAHLPRDPYAIFELAEPAYRDRFETEETVSRGTPPPQSELISRAAARLLHQHKIAETRDMPRTLAPSPHLQPTTPRATPIDDAIMETAYADFSMDEHEALMSTPLPLHNQMKAAVPDQDDKSIEATTPSQAADVAADQTSPVTTSASGEAADAQTNQTDGRDAQATDSAHKPRKPALSKSQIPLHVVADNRVAEGDETNPEDVMRNALRSMIRDQIGHWLEDNISTLIEDALREPAGERKTTPHRNTRTTE